MSSKKIDEIQKMRKLLEEHENFKNEMEILPYFKKLLEFNLKRQYCSENDVEKIKQIYLENIGLAVSMGLNDMIPKKTPDYPRILSWNVRYFTDINNNPTIDRCAKVILKLNPDIACLQEATMGNNKYYPIGTEYKTDIREYLEGKYILLAFCNTVPFWYEGVYGNMILARKEFIERYGTYCHPVLNMLCTTDKTKCYMNQYSKTYDYPKQEERTLADGSIIKYFGELNETRCFIKISLGKCDIICTHLDAYNKHNRMKQLEQLKNEITRPTILLGDLNIIDVSQYNQMSEILNKKIPSNDLNNDPVMNEMIQEAKRNGVLEKLNSEKKYICQFNNLDNGIDKTEEMKYIEETLKLKKNSDYLIEHLESTTELYLEELAIGDGKYIYNCNNYFTDVFTSWTSSKVDYILIQKGKGFDNSIFFGDFLYFTECSDHLPIITFLSNEAVSSFMSYVVNKDTHNVVNHNLSELINDISLDQDFNKHHTTGFVYNGQSISKYDWFVYDKKSNKMYINTDKQYDFVDPSMTGNFGLLLGHNGVYFGTIDTAIHFGNTFTEREISTDVIKKVGIMIFKFKIAGQTTAKISNGNPPIVLDKQYDILILKEKKIGKITKMHYNPSTKTHSQIESISPCIGVKISIASESIKYEGITNQHFETIFKNIEKNPNIQNSYNQFMNSIAYINELHNKKYNTNYIDINDLIPEALSTITTRDKNTLILYDLFIHFSKKFEGKQDGGYTKKHTKNPFTKYKSKKHKKHKKTVKKRTMKNLIGKKRFNK
jgi:endonuclease/exonuclease/phosphatase family metal-dependent hydrolase